MSGSANWLDPDTVDPNTPYGQFVLRQALQQQQAAAQFDQPKPSAPGWFMPDAMGGGSRGSSGQPYIDLSMGPLGQSAPAAAAPARMAAAPGADQTAAAPMPYAAPNSGQVSAVRYPNALHDPNDPLVRQMLLSNLLSGSGNQQQSFWQRLLLMLAGNNRQPQAGTAGSGSGDGFFGGGGGPTYVLGNAPAVPQAKPLSYTTGT